MLVAVQSPEGTKRIQCESNDSTASFAAKLYTSALSGQKPHCHPIKVLVEWDNGRKERLHLFRPNLNVLASIFTKPVQSAFNIDSVFNFDIYKERNRTGRVASHERKSLSSYHIKHGDTVYVVYKTPTYADSFASSNNSSNDSRRNSSQNSSRSSLSIVEDEVDTFLFKQNGYIDRERDVKLCQHGAHGKCVHCIPVEPYNEAYLKEQNIKHLSFHSYLRKVTGGSDKGKFAALENISCKVKSGCKEHLPWPQGICTKCQPNAITLNRQPYRHVDNVVFENPFIVERFLNYWRRTGHQRIGFLYGKYEHHKDVPLGVKATVVAIYEPPQEGAKDCLKLVLDDKKQLVDKIANALGLVEVGWIFTDLIAKDIQKGTVKYLRNISTYFLSAQECIMAGYFQNEHPNPCKLSSDGYFGSKFVTVCVTGDMDYHVHMEGYQVSNQCMALVRDSCFVPTVDAPGLGYVKESTNEQYVPDVFFKDKDSYGNEVTRLARPLPIEYLLVDVPVSTPVEPQCTFYANASIKPFNVENRMLDGDVQNFSCLASYLRQFKPDQFLEAMTDFHLLIYIATMDMLPLKDALDPLLESVRTQNRELANNWAHNEHWATVEHLLEAEAHPMPTQHGDPLLPNDESSALWTCLHCTYLNKPESKSCEMCSLPQK